MKKLTGYPGIVEGETRYQRDAAGAWTTIRTWRGFSDLLVAHADTLAAPCEIDQESGPIYRLTATYSGKLVGGVAAGTPDAQVATVWSVHAQLQRLDLWELPKVKAELTKIADAAARAALLTGLRAIAEGATTLTVLDGDKTKTIKASVSEVISRAKAASPGVVLQEKILLGFVKELASGVDSCPRETFVLRKKRVGPSQASSLVPAFTKVNKPNATGVLVASEPSMPAAIRSAISGELAAGFWLRNADELNQLDANRIEVVSQWVYGDSYSDFIYSDLA